MAKTKSVTLHELRCILTDKVRKICEHLKTETSVESVKLHCGVMMGLVDARNEIDKLLLKE